MSFGSSYYLNILRAYRPAKIFGTGLWCCGFAVGDCGCGEMIYKSISNFEKSLNSSAAAVAAAVVAVAALAAAPDCFLGLLSGWLSWIAVWIALQIAFRMALWMALLDWSPGLLLASLLPHCLGSHARVIYIYIYIQWHSWGAFFGFFGNIL